MIVRRLALAFLVATTALHATDDSSEMIRSTPWQSPAAERASFVVPPGFAVQLVAAEPDIGKPVSMSFDAAGRLWLAETRDYPIETAAGSAPRDRIRILSDFQPDGRAGKNEIFADGLSMPDAVAPYRDGAIVFSIPDILRLQDTDGDGRADRRTVVLGPFATTDTHNLVNNFRRGFDGWIYGGQGVGNRSVVRGGDGREFRMSGGAFRFRPDGSRIEKFSDGQANVFGLCFDPLGNLFTSDCHSMPIYQNIFGGFYPVFGKPHDGLGYAPAMLSHSHGSTAISGLITCEEPLWPGEFQGNFLLGNVVTNRINRDRVEERGSTRLAIEMPDLLVSRDPWFRPVDIQFGPDGALYIADFYNRIIAHVEVPLDHPGRDRTSGRLWRLVRTDTAGNPRLRSRPDFATMPLADKIRALGDPSLAHRLVVLQFLVDLGGEAIIAGVRQAAAAAGAGPDLQAGTLWVLERLGALTPAELAAAAASSHRLVRTHALRILVERPEWSPDEIVLIRRALHDPEGGVARVAADALARHPSVHHIRPLLELRRRAPEEDTHLVYQVRKALRDQLLLPEAFEFLRALPLTENDVRAVVDVALAVPTAAAAAFLAEALSRLPAGESPDADRVRHIARFGESAVTEALTRSLADRTSDSPEMQLTLFQAVQQGMEQRGQTPGDALLVWGRRLARTLLESHVNPPTAHHQAAAQLATRLRLTDLETPLRTLATQAANPPESRVAALRALLTLHPEDHLPAAADFLNNPGLPVEIRSEIARELGSVNSEGARRTLTESLRQAPERFALSLASALARTSEGADTLVRTVAEGRAPASLLTQPAVRDPLLVARPHLADQITRLTASLSPRSEQLRQAIEARLASFNPANADAARGAAVYQLHCAVCHSLGGTAGRIGPELDGIGHRGSERLAEDVLDPNRNVDHVFRHSLITLSDGSVITGLLRRDEGAVIVVVDSAGRELTVEKASITRRTEADSSLMPEIFADLLPPADFHHLLAFLLSQAAPTR